MATKKKMLQAAAGNAGGDPLDITDVFSTYLYEGTGSTRTITNGVDLADEDGLVWLKKRSGSESHYLMNMIGSTPYFLNSNNSDGESSLPSSLFSLTNSGFNLNVFNDSGADYASWTFRSAPKFFQKIRYSGNGASRSISHNLGCDVGAIFVKVVSTGGNWSIWHKNLSNTTQGFLHLNETASEGGPDSEYWDSTAPTSTDFYVGNSPATNGLGKDYIAFIFAHNDGDGEFGPDGDQDIIKCGGITTGSSSSDRQVVLGWEPQWILMKNAESTSDWIIADTMRGWFRKGYDEINQANALMPNLSDDETMYSHGNGTNFVEPTPYGFRVIGSTLGNSQDWIYIAIRAGSFNLPESVSEVYEQTVEQSAAGTVIPTGFPVDMLLQCLPTLGSQTQLNHSVSTRLTGFNDYDSSLATNSTTDEASIEVAEGLDSNTSYKVAGEYGTTNYVKLHHAFKRAKGCFDVAPYKGDDEWPLYHNLGVVPEMMWVKSRDTQKNWLVYHKDLGNAGHMEIDNTSAANTSSSVWDTTSPTDQKFYVGSYISGVNDTYLALLFASLDGVSKVGSVSHSGTTTVDCGFSAGTAYLILKRTNGTDDWRAFHGIHSGSDYYMRLNSNGSEVTGEDLVDPTSSGFQLTSSLTSGNYIYYAIAKE